MSNSQVNFLLIHGITRSSPIQQQQKVVPVSVWQVVLLLKKKINHLICFTVTRTAKNKTNNALQSKNLMSCEKVYWTQTQWMSNDLT